MAVYFVNITLYQLCSWDLFLIIYISNKGVLKVIKHCKNAVRKNKSVVPSC